MRDYAVICANIEGSILGTAKSADEAGPARDTISNFLTHPRWFTWHLR